MGYPKVTVAEVRGYALGGGFELALMADIAVVARDAEIGMPATRFLGPALGSLHLFFHRLGPVLSRRLLLTGDTVPASTVEHLGVFTEVRRRRRASRRGRRGGPEGRQDAGRRHRHGEGGVPPRRAAAGVPGRGGARATSFHAFGTNLQFEDDEFNFVKTRAQHGTKKAFELRDDALRGARARLADGAGQEAGTASAATSRAHR